jgi:predicted nucleic acid-binding protein
MIYLDTSVALAQLLAEDRVPPATLWGEPLVTCRIFEYELWTRIFARGLAATHGDAVRGLVERVAMVEMARPVLQRALEPWGTPVRTLDALHLAAALFLAAQGARVQLASYDQRMNDAAQTLGLALYPL